MKKYSAARARQRFSEVLDGAEAGAAVMIERRGRLFSLRLADAPTAHAATGHRSAFEWLDPMVVSGTWTWTRTEKGWELAPKTRKGPKASGRAKR